MEKIKTVAELNLAIQQLEYQQAIEWSLLKDEFNIAYESVKPLNLIKNTFKEITTVPDFKDNLIGATLGLTAGIVSKAIIIGTSRNPIKKLIGALLQVEVSTAVVKNATAIKSAAYHLLHFFDKKKNISQK